MEIAVEILLGVGLGFAVGLTGVGGAALAVPSMAFFLGFSTVEAIATTFPFTAIVKAAGFVQHSRQGTFSYRVGVSLLLGGVPGAVAGVALLSGVYTEYGDSVEVWVNLIIGLLVMAGAGLLFLQIRLKRHRTENGLTSLGPRRWMAGSGLGAGLGLIMGATSIGAGTLMTAPVLLIYRISADKVVGTTIGVSLALMVVGTLGYLSQDLVAWSTALFMSLGAVPAVIVGSRLTTRIPEKTLIALLTAMMLTASVSLLVKSGVGF